MTTGTARTPHVPSQSHTAADTVGKLRQTFASGRTRSYEWRISQLRGIERLVDECESEIAAALSEDLGRVPSEAWLGDIASTKGEAVFARKKLRKWMRRRRQSLPLAQYPGRGWVQHEPLGVVLVIGPWNYPVYLALAPLVAAVSAGNCAVVKPSELAPATSALLTRLIPKYLDNDAIAVVEGDGSTTQELLAQGFDHAVFTGGTEIGKKIMAGAAPHLTPVTLELGGKSPAIVAKDADLDVAARRIAWVKFMNSGQTCIAPDYVLVERAVRDQFIEKITETVVRFRADSDASGMRIVNERQFDRLAGYIAETTGRAVLGGAADRATLSIEPTIIVDPSGEDAVMRDEIFGPILPILTVDTLEDAITFVTTRPKPLANYVFAKSRVTQRKLIDQISSGGAVINHVAMHCLVPQLPFGGVGASGMGAYHGQWGFEALSHGKAVLAKSFKPDLQLVYPPYTPRALKIMRKVF
ncbi:aldehyde dehydrogenase family protein [Rhodococcus aetherivorans]|uniref:aldehyde dehydrogenase family protein n=1 Tax=Rhodococcus aetherivorans TaxID=191292 RepID=UPI0002D245CA|nr:aldehyde dehydrogenase family protein [Rhodococcus aetherivorans]CCW14894.1 Aldehyde dehydrogenase [Rhodococcus aetherivorans]